MLPQKRAQVLTTGIGRKVFTLEPSVRSRENVWHAVIDEKNLAGRERQRAQYASKVLCVGLGDTNQVRVELAIEEPFVSQDDRHVLCAIRLLIRREAAHHPQFTNIFNLAKHTLVDLDVVEDAHKRLVEGFKLPVGKDSSERIAEVCIARKARSLRIKNCLDEFGSAFLGNKFGDHSQELRATLHYAISIQQDGTDHRNPSSPNEAS